MEQQAKLVPVPTSDDTQHVPHDRVHGRSYQLLEGPQGHVGAAGIVLASLSPYLRSLPDPRIPAPTLPGEPFAPEWKHSDVADVKRWLYGVLA